MAKKDSKRKPTPYMGATKKGMITKQRGKFEQLKMAEKAVEEARKEVEVMGDKTSQDKLSKALSDWYDVHSVSSRGLSRKAMMGGGKIKKKNYAPGGSVRSASY